MIKHEPQIREYTTRELMEIAHDMSDAEFESELQKIVEQMTDEELDELLGGEDE